VTDFLRRYTLASYLVALMFIILPVVDAATNAWPWSLGNEQWRFGAAAILSGYLISIIFGLLFLAAVARGSGHKLTLYLTSAVSGLFALVLLVFSISFILDTLQLRGVVREEQHEMFKIGAVKTGSKLALSMVAMIVLAIASFKAAKDVGGSSSRA
jgi:hypothetical protein